MFPNFFIFFIFFWRGRSGRVLFDGGRLSVLFLVRQLHCSGLKRKEDHMLGGTRVIEGRQIFWEANT